LNDKKKRIKKVLLKNIELENRLNFQAPLFYAQNEIEEAEKSSDTQVTNKSSPTDVLLDPNHTHFILVDDGSEGFFGKEIEFRAHLEAELRKGRSLRYYNKKLGKTISFAESKAKMNRSFKRNATLTRTQTTIDLGKSFELTSEDSEEDVRTELVPMILIVVQGGPNTLLTVVESLKENVPVLVLAVIQV
jgi:hypothetical protein